MAEFPFYYYKFSKEEWQDIRSLVNDKSAVIKKAEKGSFTILWDHEYYIAEAEKRLRVVAVYKGVRYFKRKNVAKS